MNPRAFDKHGRSCSFWSPFGKLRILGCHSTNTMAAVDDLSFPIFTRSALLAIEENFAQKPDNNLENDKVGRFVVAFHGERELLQAKRDNRQGEFSCVIPGTIEFHPPHRDAAQANERWQSFDRFWETAPSRQYLMALVSSRQNAVRAVDKIFGLGLGPICAGATRPLYMPDEHLKEHMAVLAIAEEVARVKRGPVTIYAADPCYTTECRRALAVMGIQVVNCFGAKAFTMVDENSIVVTRYPSFPVREILADLCRPAAFIGNRQKTREEVAAIPEEIYKETGDPDTERTRQMFEEYEGEEIGQTILKDQYLYWKKAR